jgi:hypothetical protein
MTPSTEELSYEDLLSYEDIRLACLRLLEVRGGNGAWKAPCLHPRLKLDSICGEQAHLLPGATLVVLDSFQAFSEGVQRNLAGVPSLRRLLKASDASRKAGKKDPRQLDEDAREGWQEDEAPVLALQYVVNSKNHLRRFQKDLGEFPERYLKAPMPLPEDVVNMSHERVVEAALSGVLYLSNADTDAAFESVAQTLAEKASESYLAGGRTLIYGLNLPFDRLLVACSGLSGAELQQLCGRVGRTCRTSSKAEIVFMEFAEALGAMTCDPTNSETSDLFSF